MGSFARMYGHSVLYYLCNLVLLNYYITATMISEYGIIRPFSNTTNIAANITRLETGLSRSYLDCFGSCLRLSQCDSLVFSFNMCYMYSTNGGILNKESLENPDESIYGVVSSRMPCNKNGFIVDGVCQCYYRWAGVLCDIYMEESCSTINTWTKRYKLGDGNIDDMKTDLVNQVNVGSSVVVLQQDAGRQRLYKPTIVYGGLTDERLYAQISNELGLNGTAFLPFSERLHRTFYIDDTLMVATQFDNISHISNTSFTWFTKSDLRHCFNTTLGGIRHSSADECFTKIQNGGELYVKVGEKGGFASFERKTPEMNDFVFSLPFHQSLIDFNSELTSTTPPAWSIVVGSSASTNISTLTIELSEGSYTHNIVRSSENINFYVGPCWHQVYYKDVNGTGTDEGSYDALLDAVMSGKRVRVKFGSHEKVLTVTMTYIGSYKLKVDAIFKSLPYRPNNDENISPLIRFYRIDTDGKMSYCSVDVGSDTIQQDYALNVPTSSFWYVELRSWRLVLKVNDTGDVVAGSIDALKQAIQGGKGIRVQVICIWFVLNMDITVAELKLDGDVIFQSGPHMFKATRECHVATFLIDNNFNVTTREWSFVRDNISDSVGSVSFRTNWFIDD